MANPYNLTLRLDGLFPLTHQELDDNFSYFEYKIEDGLANGNTLRWVAADQKWQQSSQLVVNPTTGNVGIGVGTNPTSRLEVGGDISCTGTIDGGTY